MMDLISARGRLWLLLAILLLPGCDREATEPALDGGKGTDRPVLPAFLEAEREIRASQPWKIAYVIKADEQGNPYWGRIRAGVRQAEEDFGVDVEVIAPRKPVYDVALQASLVDDLVDSDFEGLVVIPIDTNVLARPVERFVASGRPVLVHDTPLNSEAVLTQLIFDNHLAGLKVARWVNHRLGGRGRVLILEGPLESQNSVERRNGFLEGLAEADMELLDLKPAGWLRSEARTLVRTWLNEFDEVDAILAANDEMALGAADAIESAGREDILVTGVDGNSGALEAIRDGRLAATIEQAPALQARMAVQLMIRHLEHGERYPDLAAWRDSTLITRDNVERYLE